MCLTIQRLLKQHCKAVCSCGPLHSPSLTFGECHSAEEVDLHYPAVHRNICLQDAAS